MKNDRIYDIETYKNIFTFTSIHAWTGLMHYFEISDRRNDFEPLLRFMHADRERGTRHVGFNNVGFDYPVMHFILQGGGLNAGLIYQRAMSIIQSQDTFGARVPEWEVVVPQVDLYLIHHFNNKARATSLKVLQFNMRSQSVEDLPFPLGTHLTHDQMDVLADYNFHDVSETLRFYHESLAMIEFREQLSLKYNRNFINHNDTKIGKDYFIMRLEEAAPGSCFIEGSRQPRQTIRPSISLRDVIFPYVRFDHPQFQRIHTWLCDQTITETKGVFSDIGCSIDGFEFVFGLGGIHGSVLSQTVVADADYCIIDLDVTSYYPSLAIVNRLHPEHLGEVFCDIYADMKKQRVAFAKGSAENAMLKLALNGVYGDSNNQYSPFYDPKYTMGITVNGQLLLCMLAEKLMLVPSLTLIQINTDGLTVRVRRDMVEMVNQLADWWQKFTMLDLERADYSRMWIRDVNNYIAESVNSKLKRKGAYEYDLEWHQNHSELVVAKCAEAVLVEGADIREFLHGHTDILDFMSRAKVPRSSRLELEDGTPLPNVIRYHVSPTGKALFKIMPPPPGRKAGDYKQASGVNDAIYEQFNVTGTHDPHIHTKNKSKYEERRTGMDVGYKIKVCNKITDATFADIDYNYYAKQVEALVAATGKKI